MRAQKATLTLEELIERIGNSFKQTYAPRAPAELTYIGSWLSCSTTFEQRIVEFVASVD